jgi:hypothetical protein
MDRMCQLGGYKKEKSSLAFLLAQARPLRLKIRHRLLAARGDGWDLFIL